MLEDVLLRQSEEMSVIQISVIRKVQHKEHSFMTASSAVKTEHESIFWKQFRKLRSLDKANPVLGDLEPIRTIEKNKVGSCS